MMIPYGRQDITEDDVQAVTSVLRSDFLTQGRKIPEFENALASYAGAKHCVAVNSATSALHVACLALELGPGDTLWTSPLTFVASANCALYCGAKVDFVDVDLESYNICVASLREKLEASEKTGSLPKALVVVHLRGEPADLREIRGLSRQYGFAVIEDAAHAIGARYQQETIGSCKYSDITVFSFHPVKIVTTAEGGAALTNDKRLADRMRLFRSHGITRNDDQFQGQAEGSWYYEQIELGLNYRLTDLQAALGLSQLSRIDRYVARRHELSDRYDELLESLPLVLPKNDPENHSALHLYVIRVGNGSAETRARVFEALRADGIGANVHYIPVHYHPHYRRMGFKKGDFPRSETYYETAITIPLFFGLTFEQQDFVVGSLARAAATFL